MLIPRLGLTTIRAYPFIISSRQFSTSTPKQPETVWSKITSLYSWLKTTAKEKGKPFIAWYATLYLSGLIGSYGIVRMYGKVEPEVVKEWAYKLKADKIINIEKIEMTKQNCEYFAALLLNESVDTPRLILAVLTIDRVILIGKRIIARK